MSQSDNQLLKVLISKIDELTNKVEFLMNENKELKKEIINLKSSRIQPSKTVSGDEGDEVTNVIRMVKGNGQNNSNAATPPVNVWNNRTTPTSGTTNVQTQPQCLEPMEVSNNQQNEQKEWTEVVHKRNRKTKHVEIRGTGNNNKSDFGAA